MDHRLIWTVAFLPVFQVVFVLVLVCAGLNPLWSGLIFLPVSLRLVYFDRAKLSENGCPTAALSLVTFVFLPPLYLYQRGVAAKHSGPGIAWVVCSALGFLASRVSSPYLWLHVSPPGRLVAQATAAIKNKRYEDARVMAERLADHPGQIDTLQVLQMAMSLQAQANAGLGDQAFAKNDRDAAQGYYMRATEKGQRVERPQVLKEATSGVVASCHASLAALASSRGDHQAARDLVEQAQKEAFLAGAQNAAVSEKIASVKNGIEARASASWTRRTYGSYGLSIELPLILARNISAVPDPDVESTEVFASSLAGSGFTVSTTRRKASLGPFRAQDAAAATIASLSKLAGVGELKHAEQPIDKDGLPGLLQTVTYLRTGAPPFELKKAIVVQDSLSWSVIVSFAASDEWGRAAAKRAIESLRINPPDDHAIADNKAALQALRAALRAYKKKRRAYPKDLSALKAVPANVIPGHHAASNAVYFQAGGAAPQDSGGWGYYNDPRSKEFGNVFINCTHTDSAGRFWDDY